MHLTLTLVSAELTTFGTVKASVIFLCTAPKRIASRRITAEKFLPSLDFNKLIWYDGVGL